MLVLYTRNSNDMNGREGHEGYERQPAKTQGEDKHYGVHFSFFNLQNHQKTRGVEQPLLS